MGHKNVKGLILQEYKKNEVRTRLEDDNVGTRALYQHGQQHFSRCQGEIICINMGNNTSQGVRGE